jgi:hypothetical protein
MRLWMAALLAVGSACGFSSSGDDAGGGDDGGTTKGPCFGSFVTVCFTTSEDVPKTPAMLPSDLTIELDTDSSPLCDQHNDRKDDYCVIAGAGFTLAVNQSINGYGSKPLVLMSTTTMRLEATSTVTVSSNRAGGPLATGAGANPAACVNGIPAVSAGGGYGGSFGGKGGNGEQVGGTTGGIPADPLNSPPSVLRGGCPGGTGADSGGMGGSGGGAVALIAKTSIELDGTINASGAGGRGGPASTSGGGGGGSGGMIVLDASSITVLGSLFANGGGGGQGGTTGGGHEGADGGESPAPQTAAPAGNNTTGGREGGSGGVGSSGTRLNAGNAGSVAATGNGGGGGGGGGAGFIRASGITGDLIAPPSFLP